MRNTSINLLSENAECTNLEKNTYYFEYLTCERTYKFQKKMNFKKNIFNIDLVKFFCPFTPI